MTTLYIADKIWMTVKAVEVVRTTDNSYYMMVKGRERRMAMATQYDAAFTTHDAALEYLRWYAQNEINKLNRQVAYWQEKLDKLGE